MDFSMSILDLHLTTHPSKPRSLRFSRLDWKPSTSTIHILVKKQIIGLLHKNHFSVVKLESSLTYDAIEQLISIFMWHVVVGLTSKVDYEGASKNSWSARLCQSSMRHMWMLGPQIVPVSALDVFQTVVMAIDVHIHIVTLQGSMSDVPS